jgi:hypothetical protein
MATWFRILSIRPLLFGKSELRQSESIWIGVENHIDGPADARFLGGSIDQHPGDDEPRLFGQFNLNAGIRHGVLETYCDR